MSTGKWLLLLASAASLGLSIYKFTKDASDDVLHTLLFVSLNLRWVQLNLKAQRLLKFKGALEVDRVELLLSIGIALTVIDFVSLKNKQDVVVVVSVIIIAILTIGGDIQEAREKAQETNEHLQVAKLCFYVVLMGGSLTLQMLVFANSTRFMFDHLFLNGPRTLLAAFFESVLFTLALMWSTNPLVVALGMIVHILAFTVITGLIYYQFGADFDGMENSYTFLKLEQVSFWLYISSLACLLCSNLAQLQAKFSSEGSDQQMLPMQPVQDATPPVVTAPDAAAIRQSVDHFDATSAMQESNAQSTITAPDHDQLEDTTQPTTPILIDAVAQDGMVQLGQVDTETSQVA